MRFLLGNNSIAFNGNIARPTIVPHWKETDTERQAMTMGYWKSVAAEMLPSWLKNLRMGGLARNAKVPGHEAFRDQDSRPVAVSSRPEISRATARSRPTPNSQER